MNEGLGELRVCEAHFCSAIGNCSAILWHKNTLRVLKYCFTIMCGAAKVCFFYSYYNARVCEAHFCCLQVTSSPIKQNPLGERTASERNCVANATRRRRRIPQAGFSMSKSDLLNEKILKQRRRDQGRLLLVKKLYIFRKSGKIIAQCKNCDKIEVIQRIYRKQWRIVQRCDVKR